MLRQLTFQAFHLPGPLVSCHVHPLGFAVPPPLFGLGELHCRLLFRLFSVLFQAGNHIMLLHDCRGELFHVIEPALFGTR